jgi:hypothetical protein
VLDKQKKGIRVMKLHWFVNGKALFTTEGDAPLVGQTVYAHDFSTTPPAPKRKYEVHSVDRSIMLRTIDASNINADPKDTVEKQLDTIINEVTVKFECYVDEIRGREMKISNDEAQIHLVPWSIKTV